MPKRKQTHDGAYREDPSSKINTQTNFQKRKSTRLKTQSRALKDYAATEARRNNKEKSMERLEVLEDDNYDIENDTTVVEIFNPDEIDEELTTTNETKRKIKKKKKKKDIERTRRLVLNFKNLFEDTTNMYWSISANPSVFSKRSFCIVCGSPSTYKCTLCTSPYCSVKCVSIHRESSRCLT